MKKILLSLLFIVSVFVAKAQFEIEGRVYYDSAQENLKEVYHYYLRYSMRIDRQTGDTIINPNPKAVRHGACIKYRKDGTIIATGQYKDGRESGKWLFYGPKGKTVIREEVK